MNYNYMSLRKGMIIYKHGKNFEVRHVVVDYDFAFIYCIDLNEKNNVVRKIISLSYEEFNKNFGIE